MRTGIVSVATLLLSGLFSASPCLAEAPGDSSGSGDDTVNIGGLSLVPAAFRYRPDRNARIALMPAAVPDISSSYRLSTFSDVLATSYVADRDSLLNSIRSRRGLALVTFWESAERCLFFGLNNRGEPGLSLVQRRSLRADRGTETTSSTRALFAELTQQRIPTFPQAPSVLDKL